ncbi:DNA topoisomerase 3 [Coraliomargarita sp. SDUM461004]|uniref:DNA topoisomerase n=1 Tax=Thalassobacterium sedimentorum TaxID=3041258 RepID=A0ABU1AMH7_9BACT|nr:DNA topoisomerase 3 [Coraliomargarita sp. SDUM461004]MDQ8196010.1 DNA topoisomerase 3 [Coraliomargarita sp. SDUM461004]
MKVVLAEKPSVARDIAKYLKATSKGQGYLKNDEWTITWAFGHMVELQEPEEYQPDWKPWRLSNLPIIPEEFKLRSRKDGSAHDQLMIIKKLFREADEIVCATDAGREGELIFRYILTWTECEDKPCKRLWISSLTNAAIEKGFKKLASSTEYDRLYYAAKCRSEADWIVGLNATRFFTVEYGKRNLLLSLGRVQTPILAMIVNRDLEIEYFKPKDFWEVHTLCREATFKHTGGKFEDQAKAQAILEKVTGQELVVKSVTKKNEKANPPQLYDLTSLQQDMNKRYGFTADQTLKLAQNLYESKHLTYPRTDSRYISSDIQPTIPPLLEALRRLKPEEIAPLDTAALPFNARIVDDKKVSDHHAILPTEVLGDSLAGDERKLYQAVVTRLIAVFYPPCIKAVTVVNAVAAEEPFRARGKVLVDPGWQALYSKSEPVETAKKTKGKADDAAQELPDFQKGESNPHQPSLPQFKTSAPKRFNEATLLQLMETAGKIVTDEALKEALKDKGVGTPATRASIIEVLISRNYVERKKKNLISTESGRGLISLIQDERLKSPELTGDWEFRLKQVERGEYDPAQFMSEVADYTREILQCTSAKTVSLANLGPCPICNAPVIRGKAAYGCSDWKAGCKFVLPGELWGLGIGPQLAREILTHKRSLTPHPIEVDGSKRFATLQLDKQGNFSFEEAAVAKKEAGQEGLGQCPTCGGDIVIGRKAYGCSNWRNGCKFVIWKTMAQKEIPLEAAKELLQTGSTATITGFKSKAGKDFDAKLKIVNGEVKFDFS